MHANRSNIRRFLQNTFVFCLSLAFLPGLASAGDAVFSFGNIDSETETMEILVTSDTPLHAFQFTVEGVTLTGTSSGGATASNFTVAIGTTTGVVAGVTTDPATGVIAAGTDVLVTVVGFVPSVNSDVTVSLTGVVSSGTATCETNPPNCTEDCCDDNTCQPKKFRN